MKRPPIHGIMAEFDTPTDLVVAINKARAEGYRAMDAYTPFPVEEVAEALHAHDRRVALIVLIGGILGGLAGYALQYYTSVIDYPLNIGGKPVHSWPSFIPVTFETTVLGAALSAVFGMLALNGLPMPYHPAFNVPRFALASRDQFFLCIEATDPLFERGSTRRFLEQLHPMSVSEVEH